MAPPGAKDQAPRQARIGAGPMIGAFVFPDGNCHVYSHGYYHAYYHGLFWSNLRLDCAQRLGAW